MTSDQVLNVGVVGYGFATATFHAPLIRSVAGLKLAAVSTSNPAKVEAALPGVAICQSPEQLFSLPDLDIVVIPTPNDSHHSLAAAALAAGKHVVVDKPFALNSAQAADLIQRSEKAGRLLSVFHNRRWDSEFLTFRDLLASGRLGRVTHFESHIDRFRPLVRDRWREGSGPGSGLWYDLGPHLLDQVLFLFGEPQRLTLNTNAARDGAQSDDWFHAILDYPQLRVILQASVVAAQPGPRFLVHGLSGSFVKHGMDVQEQALKAGIAPGGPGWGVDLDLGVLVIPGEPDALIPGVPGAYHRYYELFRDAVLHGTPVPVLATEALTVMKWLDEGRRSAGLP